MTLQEVCVQQRAIAEALFSSDGEFACVRKEDGSSCLRLEKSRPLTAVESLLGWSSRPFDAYDIKRLCDSCAAHWHAQMAFLAAQRLYCSKSSLERQLRNFQRNKPELFAKYLALPVFTAATVVRCPTTETVGAILDKGHLGGCGSISVVWDGEVYDCQDCGRLFSDFAADPPHRRALLDMKW